MLLYVKKHIPIPHQMGQYTFNPSCEVSDETGKLYLKNLPGVFTDKQSEVGPGSHVVRPDVQGKTAEEIVKTLLPENQLKVLALARQLQAEEAKHDAKPKVTPIVNPPVNPFVPVKEQVYVKEDATGRPIEGVPGSPFNTALTDKERVIETERQQKATAEQKAEVDRKAVEADRKAKDARK